MTENSTQNVEKQVSITAQYVKDISFESPDSPASLSMEAGRPAINISVDVQARAFGENLFEVVLKIGATAKREDKTVFIAEVAYGGIFSLINVPDAEVQPVLLIFSPTLLFPYARRIISDITRDGGFPPLLIDPIDFSRLYQQRMEQLAKEQEGKQTA
jgi:preprotein translocase subunit SecB